MLLLALDSVPVAAAAAAAAADDDDDDAPAGTAAGAVALLGAVAFLVADAAGSLGLGQRGGCPQFGKSLIFLTLHSK